MMLFPHHDTAHRIDEDNFDYESQPKAQSCAVIDKIPCIYKITETGSPSKKPDRAAERVATKMFHDDVQDLIDDGAVPEIFAKIDGNFVNFPNYYLDCIVTFVCFKCDCRTCRTCRTCRNDRTNFFAKKVLVQSLPR